MKEKEMIHAKLYDFKAVDIEKESDEQFKDNMKFTIQLYLIDAEKSYSLIISDFNPFFYIKCPSGWGQEKKHYIIEETKNYPDLGNSILIGIKFYHWQLVMKKN